MDIFSEIAVTDLTLRLFCLMFVCSMNLTDSLFTCTTVILNQYKTQRRCVNCRIVPESINKSFNKFTHAWNELKCNFSLQIITTFGLLAFLAFFTIFLAHISMNFLNPCLVKVRSLFLKEIYVGFQHVDSKVATILAKVLYAFRRNKRMNNYSN